MNGCLQTQAAISASAEPPFIKIKFECTRPTRAGCGNQPCPRPFGCQETNRKGTIMKRTALALAAAVTIGFTALAAPSPAEARWRGGWGPGIAGGLLGAAIIGGLASNAYGYGYGPGYGYYGRPYYGGYAPAYYGGGYDPYPWGGYRTTYYSGYSPDYYGYRYRRVVRPAYAYYGGPRFYHHRWHRHW
jgi:hypothetical protein